MAFQLPNLPNFNTNIPQPPDPLQQYGRLLQLKSLQGQQALQPLQLQAEQEQVKQQQIRTQQMEIEQQSQQAMMKAWSDPEFTKEFTGTDQANASGLGFDPDAMTKGLISKGVLPKDALAMTAQFVDRSQKIATAMKDQAQTNEANAATRDKSYTVLANQIGSILDAPAAKAGDMLASLKKDLVKNPTKYAGVPQEDLAHIYGADLEHLPAIEALIGLDGKIADYHKSKFAAAKEQQGVIPENGALSPDTEQQVQKDVAVATNPQVQQAKVQVAKEEGIARANVEAQIARGSNAALANVPPHLVAPATEAATKAGQDYAQAKSVSDRLQAMMDAAKKGNVVSYQLLPEEGALQVTTSQGVHRINMAEIQNYGGGSIFQRIEGHLGKQLTGKSIPQSVLSDMAEMQKVQQEGAQSKYENSLKAINQAYGSDFKAVQMDDMSQAGAGNFFSKFGGKPR